MRSNICLLALMTWAIQSHATEPVSATASDGLYVLVIKDELLPNGQRLNLALREISRESGSSLVELEIAQDADSSGWKYVLLGMCGLMEKRGRKSAVAEQISVRPPRFSVTFPVDPTINDRPGPPRLVFNEAQCRVIKR